MLDDDGRVTDVADYARAQHFRLRVAFSPEFNVEWSHGEPADWARLPIPAVDNVFAYLGSTDQVRFARVCKAWRRAAGRIPSMAVHTEAGNAALEYHRTRERERRRLDREQARRNRRDMLFNCVFGGGRAIWIFLLPGLLELAMGVTAIAWFAAGPCSGSEPACSANVCALIYACAALYCLNFVMFALLGMSIFCMDWCCWRVRWAVIGFGVLNTAGAASNAAIVGIAAAVIKSSLLDCAVSPSLAAAAHSWGAVALAFGLLQLACSIFFAIAFKNVYAEMGALLCMCMRHH